MISYSYATRCSFRTGFKGLIWWNRGLSLPFVFLLFVCTRQSAMVTAQLTSYRYDGDAVTFNCNLDRIDDGNNQIIWYHRDRRFYLSRNEIINDELPVDVSDRLRVVCNRVQSSCSLNIRNLTLEDSGTYKCGYHVSLFFEGVTYLSVSQGELPTDYSPSCELFKKSGDGRSSPVIMTSELNVDDTIVLRCTVNDGPFTTPTLHWTRSTIRLYSNPPGITTYTLSENDKGVVFTCSMTHPALREPRRCSFIALPESSTSPVQTTPTIPSTPPSRYTTGNQGNNTPSPRSNIVIPAVIAVILILIVIIVIAVILYFWLRKSKSPKSSDQIDTALANMITVNDATYASVGSPSPGHELQPINNPLYVTTQNDTRDAPMQNESPDKENDLSILYATPDKRKPKNGGQTELVVSEGKHYENLPHVGDVVPSNEDDTTAHAPIGALYDGLMYADLDLTDAASDQARMPPRNPDATVYADIKSISSS